MNLLISSGLSYLYWLWHYGPNRLWLSRFSTFLSSTAKAPPITIRTSFWMSIDLFDRTNPLTSSNLSYLCWLWRYGPNRLRSSGFSTFLSCTANAPPITIRISFGRSIDLLDEANLLVPSDLPYLCWLWRYGPNRLRFPHLQLQLERYLEVNRPIRDTESTDIFIFAISILVMVLIYLYYRNMRDRNRCEKI